MRYAILGGLVLLPLLMLGTTQDWSAATSTKVRAIDLPVQGEPVELRPHARQREAKGGSAKPASRAEAARTVKRKPERSTRASARAATAQPRGAPPVQNPPPVPIPRRDDDDDESRDADVDAARARAPAPAPTRAPAPAPRTPQGENDVGDGPADDEDAADGDD